jgi:hypothetical protein
MFDALALTPTSKNRPKNGASLPGVRPEPTYDNGVTETAASADPRDAYNVFRSRRNEMVMLPQGNLALVLTQWFTGEAEAFETVWGIPGEWALAPSTDSGLLVRAGHSDGIFVDDEPVDGVVLVHAKNSENPSTLRFSDEKSGFVIANEEGHFALRVWDPHCDERANFGQIDAYDYNPNWVVEASFEPIPGGRAVGVDHLKDEGSTRDKMIPADIKFTVDGEEYSVAAFQEGRALLLVFSDATSGDETYSVGRFLMCAPNPDGSITLDFNRAYLPPCAFSYHFNCPMPPPQNRFPFAVRAGEKQVLNKSGELLH